MIGSVLLVTCTGYGVASTVGNFSNNINYYFAINNYTSDDKL